MWPSLVRMSDNPFGRVITAMVTPMHDDGSIDFDGLRRLAVHLADNGHDGLLVNGTTGESATTTDDEDYDCVQAVVEAVGDRVEVMAGCGTNDTEHSMRAAREMVARGGHPARGDAVLQQAHPAGDHRAFPDDRRGRRPSDHGVRHPRDGPAWP